MLSTPGNAGADVDSPGAACLLHVGVDNHMRQLDEYLTLHHNTLSLNACMPEWLKRTWRLEEGFERDIILHVPSNHVYMYNMSCCRLPRSDGACDFESQSAEKLGSGIRFLDLGLLLPEFCLPLTSLLLLPLLWGDVPVWTLNL